MTLLAVAGQVIYLLTTFKKQAEKETNKQKNTIQINKWKTLDKTSKINN